MSVDFNYKFGFVVEEIFELCILENLDVSTLRKKSYSDFGVNCRKLISTKIEVEPCENNQHLFRNAKRFQMMICFCCGRILLLASAYYIKNPRLTGGHVV